MGEAAQGIEGDEVVSPDCAAVAGCEHHPAVKRDSTERPSTDSKQSERDVTVVANVRVVYILYKWDIDSRIIICD